MSRLKFPDTRPGTTHRVQIDDLDHGVYDLYLTVNRHEENSKVMELFSTVGKQGSTTQGLLDGWSILLSIALQYGVPLEAIVEKFKEMGFSPSGTTDDSRIPKVTSLLDYIVRYLEITAEEEGEG